MITNDRLDTVDAAAAVGPFSFNAGIKYDSTGRIVVSTIDPVSSWNNGLPFAADGALCVTTA